MDHLQATNLLLGDKAGVHAQWADQVLILALSAAYRDTLCIFACSKEEIAKNNLQLQQQG